MGRAISKNKPKTLLVCIIIMIWCRPCSGQGTHVHTSTNFLNPTNATTIASTFSTVSTTGNLIVVYLSYSGQTINVSGVSDNKFNTYSRINGPTNWNGTNFRGELWYAFNITGGAGAVTVTATLTAAPVNTGGLKFSQIYISEFSGIKTTNPLDQKSVNSGTAGASSTFNSGAATTLYSNELIYGGAIGGTAGTINSGTTFTSISSANSNQIEFKNSTAAGSVNAVFASTTAGTYVADMATFITTGSVLPVTLTSFTAATVNNKTVKLDWVTSSERNSDYFDVQRSHDGKEWNVVQQLKGAGNAVLQKRYTAMDETPEAGVNYYRLNQVDFDGKNEYSVVRSVILESDEAEIYCYPNPVYDWIHINAPKSDGLQVSILDGMGLNMESKVVEISKQGSTISLNVSPLPRGVYLIKIGTTAKKFYKE